MTDAEKARKIRAVYEYAKQNKNGDRLTQTDIKNAKEVLSLRKAYTLAEKNKSGDRLTQTDIKNAKEATKMNKGGGMDMGKKEEPTQWITKKEKPTQWITKKEEPTQWITKKEKPKKWITKKSRGGGMDMGQMPNTVKPRPRGNPGIVENVVGKGGDYIKDLID